MAAGNSTINDIGGPTCVIVSQLPNKLLADLKALLIGHFANFGRILRISCATKGRGERTAHIQFSSSKEASEALKYGKVMNGHSILITSTDKVPNTQMLAFPPQPIRSTLTPTSNSSTAFTEKKSAVQSTLAAYFQKKSSSKSAPPSSQDEKKRLKNLVPTTSDIFNEALQPSTSVNSGLELKEAKPNPCLKLEVYQAPKKCQPPISQNLTKSTSALLPVGNNSVAPPGLRPSRSLREILNLDTTHMKKVKTVTPSDALACQFFGDKNHRFSLSLMFGRIPGSVIMPVKSLMGSIKPGLQITDTTNELVWNVILRSVLKDILPRTAKSILQETIVDKLALESYMQLESDMVDQEVSTAAEKEVGYQEDLQISCEEVVEAMLGLVCSSLIEESSREELRASKAISKALECCFRKLTGIVIKETVKEILPHALLDCLCEEVVDDILESPIFGRHVKVVATEALHQCQLESNLLGIETSSSSSTNASLIRRSEFNILPPLETNELMKTWLETSSFDVHEDAPDIYSQSSIESDISHCTESPRCSESIAGSVQLTSSQHSNNLVVHVSTTGTPASPADYLPVDANPGFFGSLKRKAVSMFNFTNLANRFKRRRCETTKNDHITSVRRGPTTPT